MALINEEQETIITIDKLSKTAKIYTTDTNMMRRLDKIIEDKENDEWKLNDINYERGTKDVTSKEYEVPKEFIGFRKKRLTRELTDEQRKELRLRIKKMQEARKNK